MVGENGVPETPDWVLPPRAVDTAPTIPPNVHLGDN